MSDDEFPQQYGRGVMIAVDSERLAATTVSRHVFFTDTAHAEEVARQTIANIATEKLRGELQREPDDYEVSSYAATIASDLAREFRMML